MHEQCNILLVSITIRSLQDGGILGRDDQHGRWLDELPNCRNRRTGKRNQRDVFDLGQGEEEQQLSNYIR
eukprot:XP_001705530.1 Hypothetical protein GL50803_100745 [Giardia lamblia ATCC 50803]